MCRGTYPHTRKGQPKRQWPDGQYDPVPKRVRRDNLANVEPSPCTPEPHGGDLDGWALMGNGGNPPHYSPSIWDEDGTDEVMGTDLDHDSHGSGMLDESQVAEVELTSEDVLQELSDRREADSLNAHRW